MEKGGTDPKRSRRPPTELDRARAVATIRRLGTDGQLSARETEDRIEATFRARTLGELDSVVAGLPYSPQAAAETLLSHGFRVAAPKAQGPWWKGTLLSSLGLCVLWVIVWFVTGGGFGWLVLGIAFTFITFTFRLANGHRRVMSGKPARRRGFLSPR